MQRRARKQALAEGRARRRKRVKEAVAARRKAWVSIQDKSRGPIGGKDGLIGLHLEPIERSFLSSALSALSIHLHWVDDATARCLYFEDRRQLVDGMKRVNRALDDDEPMMSALDWHRAMAMSEHAYAVQIRGAASEWNLLTSFDDVDGIHVLRALQAKTLRWVKPRPVSPIATRPREHARVFVWKGSDAALSETERIRAILRSGRYVTHDERFALLHLASNTAESGAIQHAAGRALALITLRAQTEWPEDLDRMTESARKAYELMLIVYWNTELTTPQGGDAR